MKKYLSLAVLIIVAVVVVFLAGRSYSPPKQRIRELAKKLEKLAEEEKTNKILQHVARDYSDDLGHTKEPLGEDVKQLFLIARKLDVDVSDLYIELTDETRAEVSLSLKVVATTQMGKFDLVREVYETSRFSVLMRNDGADWRIYRVDNVSYSYK